MADLLLPTGGLERAVGEVLTLARPEGGPLIAARHEVQRNKRLKAIFTQARQEKWAADKLAEEITPELTDRLEAPPDQVAQVARYLADEYEQIGDTILVCSPTTGKAFARLRDEDIIQPAPVPRESGTMAKPLPRIRPDLHGFLVQWVFDEEREKQITEAIALRSHQTALQQEEGDSRLLPLTRAGRAKLTQNLRQSLPLLLRADSGLLRTFLNHFDILEEPPKDSALWPVEETESRYGVTASLADLKSYNLRYDHHRATLAKVGAGWVRDIATTLALAAREYASVRATVRWPEGSFPPEVFTFSADMWVGTPEFTKALVETGCNVLWMPVKGIPATGLSGKVGAIVTMDFDCKSREVFDRWETMAVVKYQLWVDWTRVASFDFLGGPVEDFYAEVVR